MSDTVTLPREPTEAMVRAAIEAGVAAGSNSGKRRRQSTLGDVIRAEYAAMIRVAEDATAARQTGRGR